MDAQEQAQGIDQQMAFAALDPLGRVVTDRSAVAIGFHTLAVQDGRRRTATFARTSANVRPETGVERLPRVVERPLPKDMVNGFPRGKVGGQQAPLNPSFDHIEDGVHDAAAVDAGPSPRAGFGQHRLEEGPLIVGEARVIYSDFHRPNGAALRLETRSAPLQVKLFMRFSFRNCESSSTAPHGRFFRQALSEF
jgi:hypothetical protein